MKGISGLGMLALSIFVGAGPTARADIVDYTVAFGPAVPGGFDCPLCTSTSAPTVDGSDIVEFDTTTNAFISSIAIDYETVADDYSLNVNPGETGDPLTNSFYWFCQPLSVPGQSPQEAFLSPQDFNCEIVEIGDSPVLTGVPTQLPASNSFTPGIGSVTFAVSTPEPPVTVPEPGTIPILAVYAAAGLGSWAWYRCRRVKAKPEHAPIPGPRHSSNCVP